MRKATGGTYQYTLFCWAEFSFTLERLLLLPLLWTRLKPAAGEFVGVEAVGETGFAALADGKVDDDEEEKVEEAEAPSASGRVREQFLIESEQRYLVEQQGFYRPLLFLGRTMPTTSRWNLAMIHGVRAFKSTLELCLFKGMRVFFYGLLAYRLYLLAAEGDTDFSEITGIFTRIEGNGITNLVHVLSNVARIYLELMLYSPLIIGGLVGMYAAVKALWLGEPKLQQTMGALERIHPGCCTSFVKEYRPFCNHSSNIQRLEYVLRWDGRLAVITRQQLLKSLQNALLFSRKKVREQALLSLAKLAHFSPSVLFKMKAMGYDDVYIADVTRTAAEAYECLYHYAQFNKPGLKQNILQSWHIIKAKYYIWWLGQMRNPLWSIFFLSFTLLYHTFHAGLYFSFLNTIVESINCPTKPGFTLGQGYADWSSDYTPECFQAVLDNFRRFDSSDSVDDLLKNIDRFYLSGHEFNLAFTGVNMPADDVAAIIKSITDSGGLVSSLWWGAPLNVPQNLSMLAFALPEKMNILSLYGVQLNAANAEILAKNMPINLGEMRFSFHFEPGALQVFSQHFSTRYLNSLHLADLNMPSRVTVNDVMSLPALMTSFLSFLWLRIVDTNFYLTDLQVNTLFSMLPTQLNRILLQFDCLQSEQAYGFALWLQQNEKLSLLCLWGKNFESMLSILLPSLPSSLHMLDTIFKTKFDSEQLIFLADHLPKNIRSIGIDFEHANETAITYFLSKRLHQFNNSVFLGHLSESTSVQSIFLNNLSQEVKFLSMWFANIDTNLWAKFFNHLPKNLCQLSFNHVNLFGNAYGFFGTLINKDLKVFGLSSLKIENEVVFLNEIAGYFPVVLNERLCEVDWDERGIFGYDLNLYRSWTFNGFSEMAENVMKKLPSNINAVDFSDTYLGNEKLFALLQRPHFDLDTLRLIDTDIRINSSSTANELVRLLACRKNLTFLNLDSNGINFTQYQLAFHNLKNSFIENKCQDLRCHAGLASYQQCGIDVVDQSKLQLPTWLTWRNLVATAAVVILLYAVYTFYQFVRSRRRKQRGGRSPSRCCGLFQRKQSAGSAARPSVVSLQIGLIGGTQAMS